jgi:hypothetical protein
VIVSKTVGEGVQGRQFIGVDGIGPCGKVTSRQRRRRHGAAGATTLLSPIFAVGVGVDLVRRLRLGTHPCT